MRRRDPSEGGAFWGTGIRYTPVSRGRSVFTEQLALVVTLMITGLALIGLETTALSDLPLPLPGQKAASPALGLLFSMAVGFLYGEREGGLTGLFTGWITDATLSHSLMLYPILHFLCGYLSGTVGKRRLAHNLPSFMVFSIVGGGLRCLWGILLAAVEQRGFSPLAWVWTAWLPGWVLTVLFSAAVYGVVWLEKRLLRSGSHGK